MRHLGAKLLCLGFVLGLGAMPAAAQQTPTPSVNEVFQSGDADEGLGGSSTDIWDMFHRTGSLRGVGQVDESFRRSQSRQINRQVSSFREMQRQRLEQQAAEEIEPANTGDVVE